VTTTYMGGRRGPPDGHQRPLRGLPGGRARPRPPPRGATSPDDDRPGQRPAGDGDPPGDGSGGVVRPLRPLRVIPGGGAPPLRVIPGGAQAPPELADGDGHAPEPAPATTAIRPPPVAGTAHRTAPRRRRWLAAVLAVVVVAGLAVAGRVVAERPATGTASTAPATSAPATSAPGSAAPVPSPVVATIGTGGFSYDMVAGAGALWVVQSGEVTRIDPGTDSVTARIPVAVTGSGPAAVAVGTGAVWVPAAVPAALWSIDPRTNRATGRIPLGGPLRGAISVSAAGDTVWVACCGETAAGFPASSGRLLRVDPHHRRVVADIPLPASPAAVAADAAGAWVATADGQVLLVSRKRNRVVARIDAGGPLGFSQTIAVGAGGVWLADPFDEQIVRIDPKTRRVMARIRAGAVTTLAVTGDAVWGLSSMGLVRVDPAHDRVAAVAPDPDLRRARFVAADPGVVWTAGWSSVSRVDPDLMTP
jgi:DNA-binding beta-propeller fold protein YncE